MTTKFFGDVDPGMRHASFVRTTPVDFVVICPQCGDKVVARDVDPNRAARAAGLGRWSIVNEERSPRREGVAAMVSMSRIQDPLWHRVGDPDETEM
jgi:hypothetical protein